MPMWLGLLLGILATGVVVGVAGVASFLHDLMKDTFHP